ncbi:DEAD/DEAH box helicase [Acholeplasma sp. OttesenSCG-928-E16]|nr:DEAD/DEAH box helicase [Acholeplasma sp. OttesenSCG-928-E16]
MKFNDYQINDLTKKALEEKGFLYPTRIQELTIPEAIKGVDILALAPTGTGKTLAFLIPILEKLTFSGKIEALILCPTRELAIQIENEAYKLTKYYKELKMALIYGGQRYDTQFKKLKSNPAIVIGTTGRILDHINRNTIKLDGLTTLILDEADEMLNMGFKEDIDTILNNAKSAKIQKLFFSATIPKEIENLSKTYQKNPVQLKVKNEVSELPNIKQYYLLLRESEKVIALISLIKEHNFKLVLVFCNTKKKVDDLNKDLAKMGMSSDVLHGDLNQNQRDKAMNDFRNNKTEVLIATDVAARGIDVSNIEAVFNYDVPQENEYYVHRIGRTARAKKSGISYSFMTTRTKKVLPMLEKITNAKIERTEYKKYDFNQIDEFDFNKTIQIASNTDLTPYKEFIENKVSDKMSVLDIAASLLMKQTVPDFVSKDIKNDDEDSKEELKIVKYFINVGKREKFTEKALKEYLIKEVNLKKDDIKEVFVTDMYSLIRVRKEAMSKVEGLGGKVYKGRIINVELSTKQDKSKRPPRKNKTEKRNYKPRRDHK